MQEHPIAYIPMDRRQALARGATLPDRTEGAALFADISGFTPLTEALLRELGPQRGAEELTRYLNDVYDALIDELHRWGGSAVAFAGDAITCWFDQDDGLRAVAAALAMQKAMARFVAVQTPKGTTLSLYMKASVAVGAARRFVVGDPNIRLIDAVAGETLQRLAEAEHVAERGNVILDPQGLVALEDAVEIVETRYDEHGHPFGVVGGLTVAATPSPWQPLDPAALPADEVRRWLLAPVYSQLQRGLSRFLAELRPTVAMFLRFGGIEYDEDEDAGVKLDAFVRWVQNVVERYEGTFVDLNIGDKGSYIYVTFGAPIAHEDNAARAAAAALDLQTPPAELACIEPLQIGISQGRMRTGSYGGAMHRTYGALGDEVNLAARLMMAAKPGQTLVSRAAQADVADQFEWGALPPLRVKGKRDPIVVFELLGSRRRTVHLADVHADPLVGREQELALLNAGIEAALAGHGQIVSLVADAGIGKSRLVAAAINRAEILEFATHAGECESFGINSSYLVWQTVWRTILDIDPDQEVDAQIQTLYQHVRALDERLARRVPLLGPVLNLPIPDNELTESFDAKLRKSSLEALLVDCVRIISRRRPLLIVLEDCHWIDALSQDLLEVLGQSIADLPVLILYTYRPLLLERLESERLRGLPHNTRIHLEPLPASTLGELARRRLAQEPGAPPKEQIPDALIQRIVDRAEGNPFFLEELVNYIGDRAFANGNAETIAQIELPSSLHSLVLARLDRLSDRQRTLLKIASVIGRVFRVDWLLGVYPELGQPAQVHEDLAYLSEQELTHRELGQAEMAYSFNHIITHGVIYESLPHMVRTTLHEQIGEFIEESYPEAIEQYVYVLAYHFDHGTDRDRKCRYLRRAGDAAQATYANEAAIDYYRRVLSLLDVAERIAVLRKLGVVLELVGQWDEAGSLYGEALKLAQDTGDTREAARSTLAIGILQRLRGNYAEAFQHFTAARALFEEVSDPDGVAQVLDSFGTLSAYQGDYDGARTSYLESLRLRRKIGDRNGEARLLNNLAIIAGYQGDYTTAIDLHQQSLTIGRALGDQVYVARSLSNQGLILSARGDYTAARARLEEAVELLREIGHQWLLANALNNLGNAVRALGDYALAGRLYSESLTMNRALGDRWAIASLLEDIGILAALQVQAVRAVTLIGAAAGLREAIGAPLPPADAQRLAELTAPAFAALGDGADTPRERGRKMTLEEAIRFALDLGDDRA